MSTAPLPAWVTAALKGLAPGDPNYATVKKAVLALASRFTTAGVEPNRKFIETMRDVQAVDKLGAVIAGLAVLLDHKGTEGMSKEEASEALDAHVARLAAATATGGDAAAQMDARDAADEAASAASQARVGIASMDQTAESGTGAPTPDPANVVLHPSPPSVLKF